MEKSTLPVTEASPSLLRRLVRDESPLRLTDKSGGKKCEYFVLAYEICKR